MGKKLLKYTFLIFCCLLAIRAKSQVKIGYVSLNDLIMSMPESKKVDSALEDLKQALSQNFQDFQNEFAEQNKLLSSKDTTKFTTAQLEVKRKNLQDLYQKLGTYRDDANQQLQKKEQDLIAPIQQKAIKAIQDVAKENGYTYIIAKEQLYAFPASDDVLTLTERKLGIK
jgi:outer membrane protein